MWDMGELYELFVGPNHNALPGSQVFTHTTLVSSREYSKSLGSPQV